MTAAESRANILPVNYLTTYHIEKKLMTKEELGNLSEDNETSIFHKKDAVTLIIL